MARNKMRQGQELMGHCFSAAALGTGPGPALGRQRPHAHPAPLARAGPVLWTLHCTSRRTEAL